ncbi:MAG: trigger factor [Nitrospirota bacterium]|nr:trigger factor [Nitrospirota bacterium]
MSVDALEVEVIDKGGLKRDLSFEVPAEVVSAAADNVCNRLAGQVRLPGFRPGRVPRAMLRSRFREEIRTEVLQTVLPDYYQQAIEKAKVNPAGQPEFSELDYADGKPLKVVVSMEVQPDIDVADWKGMALTGFDLEVTDHDLTVAHESLLNSMASLEPAAKTAKAKDGDTVLIDFTGSVDGEEFPGGKAEGYSLALGEGRFIPGFEEQLLGHKAGELFDIQVTFPDDYQEASLKGKEATFAINLREIRNKILPELNDDFATQVGDFDNLEALNEVLRKEIRAKREADQRRMQRREALSKLAEDNPFAPPQTLVEEELEALVEQNRRYASMIAQGGTPDFDPEEARAHHQEEAVRQVRANRVIEEIAKSESVALSEDEVSAEIMRLAREYQQPVDQVDRAMRSNPVELDRMKSLLLRDKVLDVVIDHAKVTIAPREDEKKPAKAKKAPAKAKAKAKKD